MNTNGDDEDNRLIERFLSGDESAFKALVRRHQQSLYEFIWRQVHNHADAADLCQKAFIQVFLKVKTFRGEAKFKTWLYQIAINSCKNFFRSRDREQIAKEASGNRLVPETAGPMETDHWQKRRVIEALGKLPEKQRETVRLRFYSQLTFAEIAATLACTIGTAKSNYHHGINTLRKMLTGFRDG